MEKLIDKPLTDVEINRAIQYIEESRRTHEDWKFWLEWDPSYPTEDVGDIRHHQQCIDKYTYVIDVLINLRDEFKV